jgi:hypothetical protein
MQRKRVEKVDVDLKWRLEFDEAGQVAATRDGEFLPPYKPNDNSEDNMLDEYT